MEKKIEEKLVFLNQLYKQQDDIYRGMAARCGLSDASFWVLYAVTESEESYSQNDLCNAWFFPKQTINSAINNLVKMGFVVLSQIAGTRNRKAVELTEEGKAFCEKNIVPLLKAESKSFERFSEEEQELFLTLFEKQLAFLREEVDQLTKEKEENHKGE
ncbi:MAG: MarR family transcriptional regulator [Lachnospiraceae bacterium]|nr:MarR family transcriptional regulator [Lachnospiraceae bacterium]